MLGESAAHSMPMGPNSRRVGACTMLMRFSLSYMWATELASVATYSLSCSSDSRATSELVSTAGLGGVRPASTSAWSSLTRDSTPGGGRIQG